MNVLPEFIEVPVTMGFDSREPIGSLWILRSALPPTSDFVFSIGYAVKDGATFADMKADALPYELLQVALLPDANYIGYLRAVGKLPPLEN